MGASPTVEAPAAAMPERVLRYATPVATDAAQAAALMDVGLCPVCRDRLDPPDEFGWRRCDSVAFRVDGNRVFWRRVKPSRRII